MNLKILASREMVTLTDAWTEAQRPVFESIPEIKALYPKVVKVHVEVLHLKQEADAEEQIARLTEELEQLDDQHDQLIRALWGVLTANIEHLQALQPPRTEQAEHLRSVRDRLLPERLSHVMKSYLEESGFAAQSLAQLSASFRETLGAVPMFSGDSALELVLRWVEVGSRLGDAARRRGQLKTVSADAPSDFQCRVAWSQVVQRVLDLLEISDAPAASIAAIRNPVVEAVAAAERRAKERTRETASSTPSANGASASPATTPSVVAKEVNAA